MKKLILLLIISNFLLSACGSRQVKVLEAEWTSMKHSMPPSSDQKLVQVTTFHTEYCMDAWSGSYGLMDEAVKKAESTYGIDYIKYPVFTQSVGKDCVQISGDGYRLAK